MVEATTQEVPEGEMYFVSTRERIAYKKNMARVVHNLKNPGPVNDAPIQAPTDQATFTTSGGIAKPIGLKEVADFYSVSPSMNNLYGKGPAPSSGPISLSIFEGAGGTTRIVGRVFIDRWDDVITTSNGLFSRPDYSWDNNDNTSIGNNNSWKACLNNWGWLTFGLLSDPAKVVAVQNVAITMKTSHVTKDDFTNGKKSTQGTWKTQYINSSGGLSSGKLWGSTATSTNYSRHIKSNTMTVVKDGAINSSGWPNTSDWDGVKRWIAGGFLIQFYNGPIANGQAAWANAFWADVDITVKI